MSPARVYVALVSDTVDVAAVMHRVASPGAGATAIFIGTVRDSNDGRPVVGIDYQAYPGMAERELQGIAREAAEQFGTQGIAVVHRTGYLALGAISIAIAASHARRGSAFDATRFVIEQVKRRVPIWKREHYADGTREWVDPTRGARVGSPVPAEAAI